VGRAHLPVGVVLVVDLALGWPVCLVRLVGIVRPLHLGFAGLLGWWGLGIVAVALHWGEGLDGAQLVMVFDENWWDNLGIDGSWKMKARRVLKMGEVLQRVDPGGYPAGQVKTQL
jgi:hypothetical protein